MYIPGASWSPPWTHSDMFRDYCGTSDCNRGDLIFIYNLVDGICFTTDDGFNIRSGSPAMNAGSIISQTRDIRNNSISWLSDIGAYEYVSDEVDVIAPVAPVGFVIK